jgi:hypothetical protein
MMLAKLMTRVFRAMASSSYLPKRRSRDLRMKPRKDGGFETLPQYSGMATKSGSIVLI